MAEAEAAIAVLRRADEPYVDHSDHVPGGASAVDERDVTFGAPSWDGRYVPINAAAARHPTVSSVWDWQEKKLVQWCHGAPGMTTCSPVLQHDSFDRERGSTHLLVPALAALVLLSIFLTWLIMNFSMS